MRIGTLTFFQQFNYGNGLQQQRIAHLQQQLTLGRRITSPSDDPIGAARSLDMTHTIDQLRQYQENADFASQRLDLEESALTSVTDILQRVRELAVNAANAGVQSQQTYTAIRTEIEQHAQQLLNIANTRDASGQYLFSGFQGNAQSFSRAATGANYNGDQGQLQLQVGVNRQVAVNDSGAAVFMQIRNGNGRFHVSSNAANTGSGVITIGSVINQSAFQAHDFTLRFTSPTTYDIIDDTTATTIVTGATYTDGGTIAFNGSETIINGTPQTGDEFYVQASRQQDLFTTMQNFITALTGYPVGTTEQAQRQQQIHGVLQDIDQSLNHIVDVRTGVGARQNTIDNSRTENESVSFELTQHLSSIRDLDYAEAISSLQTQLTSLEAARKSFISIQQLSLFNYIR